MTNEDRILSAMSTSEICDDCLSESSGVHPRQTVYTNCSQLAKKSAILRYKGKCNHCTKSKTVSRLSNTQPSNIEKEDVVVSQVDIIESKQISSWYWEGNVQGKVVEYLVKNGYKIRSVADTASRAPGKDIVSITPQGDELWVSVKGYPEKSSNVQARHWFSEAIFDLILYRDENPFVKLALAFPDGFATYTNLSPRVDWLKHTMSYQVFWVSEDGSVRCE